MGHGFHSSSDVNGSLLKQNPLTGLAEVVNYVRPTHATRASSVLYHLALRIDSEKVRLLQI